MAELDPDDRRIVERIVDKVRVDPVAVQRTIQMQEEMIALDTVTLDRMSRQVQSLERGIAIRKAALELLRGAL